jgi:hypothetical protein
MSHDQESDRKAESAEMRSLESETIKLTLRTNASSAHVNNHLFGYNNTRKVQFYQRILVIRSKDSKILSNVSADKLLIILRISVSASTFKSWRKNKEIVRRIEIPSPEGTCVSKAVCPFPRKLHDPTPRAEILYSQQSSSGLIFEKITTLRSLTPPPSRGSSHATYCKDQNYRMT